MKFLAYAEKLQT